MKTLKGVSAAPYIANPLMQVPIMHWHWYMREGVHDVKQYPLLLLTETLRGLAARNAPCNASHCRRLQL